MNNTIYRLSHQHVGQMRAESAPKEIERLERQTGRKWRTDKSPFLYCEDETDENVHNPCELSEGFVWVVRDIAQ